MSNFFATAFITFILTFVGLPIALLLGRMFGLYTTISEGQSYVYVIFGRVIGVLNEPGLHFLPARLGLWAFIVNFFGRRTVLDMRLDQTYLRSQPVNSEEGAPMGIGIWYEMYICDPVAFLFRNADPRGSLGANVSNATVRCLSNMPLGRMLEDRHGMSQTVRTEVSPKSAEWGYKLGSIYIRKVHFRDVGMIRQIEAKVVNRLRQVTSAIKQDGANQVSIIASSADRLAAVEFGKAQAIHPTIVGGELNRIARDPEVAGALFEILQMQELVKSKTRITLVPSRGAGALLPALLASRPAETKEQARSPETHTGAA